MELRSLAGASHPHVVAYRESYLADGAVTILMEHMDGGSLADVLSKVGRAAAAATARGWGRPRGAGGGGGGLASGPRPALAARRLCSQCSASAVAPRRAAPWGRPAPPRRRPGCLSVCWQRSRARSRRGWHTSTASCASCTGARGARGDRANHMEGASHGGRITWRAHDMEGP
jgi:hypothetical protein